MKMVETTRQVRVDNWGIYFLQRLQLFFSKTDYCDLTLQFEGNVQLKVHRLVMNACTEYFAFLEQTCPALEENTIMMPTDLQADVIVPIVNFMYTGMLEFHPSIFEKLFKAAEIMNIAVLTKLLEAQLQRLKPKPKKEPPQSWGGTRKTPKLPPVPTEVPPPTPSPVRKVPMWRKRNTSSPATHPVSATFSNTKWNSDPPEKDPLSFHDNTPKPTRFEWPDDDQPPFSLDPSFDDVSLTSKPLWTQEDDQKVAPSFEDARSLAQKSRQPSSTNNSISQDMEEEEQKVNIAQLDETVNISGENLLKRKADSKMHSSPKRVRITNQEDETIISIKTNNPSELDHTKIVSEILKKYPDLVKKKKNIKLKITSLKSETSQVKVQPAKDRVRPQAVSPLEKPGLAASALKEIKVEPSLLKTPSYRDAKKVRSKADFRAASDEGPWTCMECLGDGEAPEFVLYYLFRKHMTDVHQMEFDASLCKYCGKKCPTDKAMAYHLYTKHGLRPPSNIKFPKCANCPFIGVTNDKIQEHMKIHGKDEVQCVNCKLGFLTNKDLLNHQSITGHHNRSTGKKNAFPAMSILDCAYCMKKLQSPVSLFTHIRSQHMKEARRDGITSLDEIMDVIDDDESETSEAKPVVPTAVKNTDIVINRVERQPQPVVKEKVNIISNVKVPDHQEDTVPASIANAIEQDIPEPVPVTVATTTSAALSNIGGSLAANLGLVDIVVLDDNQQYILQQPQGQSGGAEFILPELTGNEGILQAATAAADLNSTDELVMVLTDHDYQDEQSQGQSDNSNIVVLYSHPVEGQQGQFITSQGNLLVNSQGLIEIRNGAGITTTASQILVNSDSTTTTQAIESPIESIEMIRKEIEGAVAEQEGEREKIKSVLRKKVLQKEINKIQQEVAITKVSNKNRRNNIANSLENGARTDNEVDTTDSTIQEEPMEVDEIVPQHTGNMEQIPIVGQEENPSLTNAMPDQKQGAMQDGNDQTNVEAGQDIPPDLTREAPQHQEEEEEEIIPENNVNTSSEEGVSKEPVEENQISEDSKDPQQVPVDEPMEVDGGKINHTTPLNEQLEDETQADTSQFETENNTNTENPITDASQFEKENVSNTEAPVVDSSDPLQHQHPDSFMNDQEELSEQEGPHHNLSASTDNQDQSIEGDQESLVEHEPLPDMQTDETKSAEHDHEQNVETEHEHHMENEQQQSLEINQEPNLNQDSQPNTVANEEEPSIANNPEPTTENDIVKEPSMDNVNEPRSIDNDQHMDNDQNDQNDNVQSNFDDFTDESQQSASQKVPRDLNKEILDDWDDTDSQQSHSQESHSQEQESHEEVQDQAALNAAENVNKLMDDWDEEDEEQSKE